MLRFFKREAKKAKKPSASILETYPDKPPDALFEHAAYDPQAGERGGYSNYSYWGSTLRMFRKNTVAMFFLWLLLALLLFTFIQPLLPGQRDPNLINNDPETGFMLKNQQPSSTFWFGTNAIGQDLWSRLWSGTRTSLFIGVVVAFFEALIGILMGALWGYVRKLDRLFTEIYNVIDNIPTTIIRIQPLSTGEILFKGQRISGRIPHALDQEITRQIQMIFQDPMASLNERAKVEYIVAEGLHAMHKHVSREYVSEAVSRTLSAVGLLPEFASRFPHEFSGGQRQRIGIARALIMEPEFIIADEPISAPDISIRAQVLNLLARLQRERALTYLFISHDLSVMRFICDRIAVVHLGQIVELADTDTLYRHPLHPYTRALLSAIPLPNPHVEHKKKLLVYDPSVHDYTQELPEFCEIEPGHFVLANRRELEGYRRMLETASC